MAPHGGGSPLQVRFFGVRGSCPCSSDRHRRYGGNTACVVVEVDGDPPIVLDLGTGLRPLGDELSGGSRGGAPVAMTALLTHLHWDHLIGLPFFGPLQRHDTRLEVFGPPQGDRSLREVVDSVVRPPFFPVSVEELESQIGFHEVSDEALSVGSAKVTVRSVPHLGNTLGFRIEADGAAVAFVSDHQAPPGCQRIAQGVLELCDGADLVIHDSQYSDEEFASKGDWGHSTAGYAVHVAAEAGAGMVALFHHDPANLDEDIDVMVERARASKEGSRLEEIVAAAEGLTIGLRRH